MRNKIIIVLVGLVFILSVGLAYADRKTRYKLWRVGTL